MIRIKKIKLKTSTYRIGDDLLLKTKSSLVDGPHVSSPLYILSTGSNLSILLIPVHDLLCYWVYWPGSALRRTSVQEDSWKCCLFELGEIPGNIVCFIVRKIFGNAICLIIKKTPENVLCLNIEKDSCR